MKFSIITPSFRQLDWLALCIASISDQQLGTAMEESSVEHIVQDGGSTGIDELGAGMLEALGAKEESPTAGELFVARRGNYRLRIYQENDLGMYDALQRGFARAGGDIISWLNCDEQYLAGTLQKVARHFRSESDLLLGDTILLDSQLVPRSYRKAVSPDPDYIQAFQMNLHSSSLFFRDRVVKKFGYPPVGYRSISDAKWIHCLLKAGALLQIESVPLSTFILGESNLSSTPISVEEKKAWADELFLSREARALLRIKNTVHRLFQGAYLPRRTQIAIFTPENKTRRKQYPARWLGFRFRTS